MNNDELRELHHRCDPSQPLTWDDARNVDIDGEGDEDGPRAESWVERVARGIELSSGPTTWLMTGPPGCGKSTELQRLGRRLSGVGQGGVARHCPVYIQTDTGTFINPSEPILTSQILSFISLAVSAYFERSQQSEKTDMWPESGPAREILELLADPKNVTSTNGGVTPVLPGTLTPETRQRFSVIEASQQRQLIEKVRAVLIEYDKQATKERGKLVILVDSLNKLQGHSNTWNEVLASAERFFRALPRIDLPVHIVFTVPPALLTRDVPNIEVLPLIRLRKRGTRTSFDPGISALRELVRRRISDDLLAWLLGPDYEARVRQAIMWSAGSPRELVQILRKVTLSTSFPLSDAAWARLGRQQFEPYTPLVYANDLDLLARIHDSGYLFLDTGAKLDTIARMLERNLLCVYRDTELWYDVHPAVLQLPHFRRYLAAAARDEDPSLEPVPSGEVAPAVRVEHVELEQIRCFDTLNLTLRLDGEPTDWVLILGDNAHGKSTVLRAIALGLCAESEAAALLEATPGPLLRYGQTKGRIVLALVDRAGKTYRSVTEIVADPQGEPGQEQLRRVEWELEAAQVFVCAYGANRTRTADLSHAGYSRHDAVRSLFDDETSLQNPELILRRQHTASRKRIEHKLLQILMLDPARAEIDYSNTRGLEIRGPWTSGTWVLAGLPTLSDGYRSTTQWVIDLIGWLVYAGRFVRDEDITGIVLIDELEQHLHPRWQRYIIALLQAQFPAIQFIASTHTPLLILGLADHERGLLVQLSKDENQRVHTQLLDPREFRGLRADQVLTSHKGFGLPTTRSPGSATGIARYAELSAMSRTEAEEREITELRAQLEETFVLGETPYERRVEAAVREALAKLATQPPGELEEFELRRQLNELFDEEESA